MFRTNVTIYHHLISQAGWNRCNLPIYLSSSPRIEGCHCGPWETPSAWNRGPCLQYCMSICGNKWIDALHAAQIELLVSSMQNQVGWFVFLV